MVLSANPALGQKVTNSSDQKFHAYVSQGVREGALILTVALCAFLLMALGSHSANDPGWTSTGTQSVPLNYGGRAGAWLSDILLYFFGYVAYLFPVLIGFRACLIFKYRKEVRETHWPLVSIRVIGFVVTMLGATGILAMYSISGLDDHAGGILGYEFAALMLQTFNPLGGTLLLVSMLLFGLTVFTGISWLGLMDRTGAFTIACGRVIGRGLNRVYSFIKNYLDVRRDLRAQRKLEQDIIRRQQEREAKHEALKEPVKTLSESKASVEKVKEKSAPALKKVLGLAKKAPTETETQEKVEPKVSPSTDTVVIQQKKKSAAEAESDGKSIKISPFVKKSKQGKRLEEEQQGSLFIGQESALPSLTLLDPPEKNKKVGYSPADLESMSRLLEVKLADFGVSAEVVEVNPGPVITRFEIQPAPGVKVSKISNLAKDLARSLAVMSVRVVEVIPGKSVIGIEIPNEHREIVRFSEVLSSKDYDDAASPLSLGLGNDIAGDPVVADLAKMPHLLVAGTTGSGKSVGVNSMILSMLFKSSPDEVRFIMVDPKMLELSVYDGIPHLLTPVVTDMKEAANALRWCVAEMERRYKLMASLGVRNIAGYNRKVKAAAEAGEPILDPLWQTDEHLLNEEQHHPELTNLPFIVVVIDEFADMMMIVGKKVEELIARIAQKARAAGIHLILATQRPSVDVITGLIKANVPTRISFQVSSKIDSRTVLDQGGAEQLLGHGDMLYMPPGTSVPVRVHGAFVDDHEVHKVVDDWKQRGQPNYLEEVLSGGESSDPIAAAFAEDSGASEQDALFDEAVAFVTTTRRVSISSVQRKLKIGYNRAANLVEAMEQAGVVSEAGHNGSREVLAPPPPEA
ncbi:cell division protein FtsK [Oleiphilus sp. HI0009]|nr:cell division protein FtsK [Oleiphilus sp. HI0009]KZY64996.1 cell division protein FtsK [Oleiphilus sp. HI0066]KZY71213.1 cell division protein FtsK [Oleiphilus sp. HI0067]